MFPKIKQTIVLHNKNKQQGSMLILSLFVITVLALLGLTLTKLLSSTSESIIYEVLGQRALNAAKAGIECKISKQFPIAGAQNCTEPDSKTFSGIPGLDNCSYNTTLENVTVVDGHKSFTFSKFSSAGQCSAGSIIVSRTIYVDAMVEL